jgi:hypothetical protein
MLQRANERGAILDPAKDVASRRAAGATLDRLEAAWPGDADAQLLVALGRKQLEGRADARAIGAVEDALRAGAPGPVGLLGQRHATVFFARQGIAISWRSLKQWNEAEDAYHLLMVSAQTAHEELGLGINMMAMLGEKAGPEGEPDLEPIATFFEWAVSQPWSYSDSQMLLQNYTSFMQRTPEAAARLASLLAAGNTARQVAGAQLLFGLEKVAEVQADAPDAAPATEKTLRQIRAQLNNAVALLKEAAKGPDRIVAGRALALLAENALMMDNNAEAASYLRSAIILEPLDLPLRVALVKALVRSDQRAAAVDARNDILVCLPRDGAALRQCAILSLMLGLNSDAVRLASQAQSQIQMTRSDAPASLEAASFTLARAYLASDQRDLAGQIYKKLADPQWQLADRAAALLDWKSRLSGLGYDDEAEAVAAQLDALAPNKVALQTAHAYLDRLDSL